MPSAEEQSVTFSTPMADLPGVGPRRAMRFRRLGIETVSDLLRHLPMRYEHEHAEDSISMLPMDGKGTARGTLLAVRYVPGMGKSKGRFEATLQDLTQSMLLVWFNASYLRKKLHPGMVVRVQGKLQRFNGYPQMVNPKWEVLDEPDRTAAKNERQRPVYPSTENLSSEQIEKIIGEVLPKVLPNLPDPLPAELVKRHNMPPLADAFRMVHRPADDEEAAAARRRLAFNELMLLQLGIAIKRHYNGHMLSAPALRWSEAIDEHIRERFPFELTDGQNGVIRELIDDLKQDHPMNRLLQGDVGAGKTVVALYAMLMAVANRKQAALMAPTELLAEQHALSIAGMMDGSDVRIELLTAGAVSRKSVRDALQQDIAAGKVDLVIGTQALLTESVKFHDLGVVVIDEQHRFGVMQRSKLRSANASNATPHTLVMTATPIPRTLSITVFGDLDVSVIKGLPPGRKPIATRVVGEEKAEDVYNYAAERLARGEQVYVVLPAIDDTGGEKASPLNNVQGHLKMLRQTFFKDYVTEAVHGRLKRDERADIMQRFRSGEVNALVATTVIEVGVDVPNATVMIVEHAERFGLAQLHQLRGRIGRGGGTSKPLCVFIAEAKTDDGKARLDAIAGTNDGFRIAEQDLEIRGMGELFGTRQSGAPPLRVARIPGDLDLLKLARKDAEKIIKGDPTLSDKHHELLHRVLWNQYGEMLGLIDVA